MNELALFAGAGGGLLGTRLLGWRCVCAVEIDPYCQAVMLARQADGLLDPFPIWADVRDFDGRPWRGIVDVVTAGWPCQPHSTAARGRNAADTMWDELVRVIDEVCPAWIILENVLERSYPAPLAPARIDCADLGAPHQRPRYWLVAHADSDSQPSKPINGEVAALQGNARLDWWKECPAEVVGVDDGVAHRVDRLKALGNGQVPPVVRAAWELLS